MTKTLAALAIIIVALGMAWGINQTLQKHQAATSENVSLGTPSQTTASTNTPLPTSAFPLQITTPLSGSHVQKPALIISGKTAPGAEVSLDDKTIKADSQGKFSFTTSLDEGDNEMTVVANDDSGAYAETLLKVSYDPAQ